jgi:hypothetical protein
MVFALGFLRIARLYFWERVLLPRKTELEGTLRK